MSTAQETPSDNRRPASSQLNGWKEIAAFFGKGVRTVQRWEREMALPVHRLPGPRSDIVYALPSELRAWRLEQETHNGEDRKLDDGSAPSPAASAGEVAHSALAVSRRSRRARYLVGALLMVGVVAVAGTVALLRGSNNRPSHGTTVLGPATGAVRGNTLVALDERGAALWSHRFETPLEPYDSAPSPSSSLLRIADIDGDGGAETLFFAAHQAPAGGAFYCFESDGRIRFKRTLESRHIYGNEVFAAPWRAHRLLTHEPSLRSGEILDRLDSRHRVPLRRATTGHERQAPQRVLERRLHQPLRSDGAGITTPPACWRNQQRAQDGVSGGARSALHGVQPGK